MTGRPRTIYPDGRKVCSKCIEWRALEDFSYRSCARNLRRSQCKRCDAEAKTAYLATDDGAEKAAAYKSATREQQRLHDRARRARSPEHTRALAKKHRLNERARARRREYLSRPEVRARVNELRRTRRACRYRQSIREQLNVRMACLIRRSLKTGKNSRSWRSLVDYDILELRQHLERQFTDGMDWAAFLRGEIHIDHIRPLSSFQYTTAESPEFAACWGLANLRPLWAAENRRKRNRMEFLV